MSPDTFDFTLYIVKMPINNISDSHTKQNIAVLIPCYNEEVTIKEVVRDFQKMLPEAIIYVYDNNSRDNTIQKAKEAGAVVRSENRQGKGFVVQRMFREIDADIYIMVDGDSTYPAAEVNNLILPILNGQADMVVGSRLMKESDSEFKKINHFGNKLFLKTINFFFNVNLTDILSGYRAFTKNFVKTLPLFGGGFETETELTIKALSRRQRIVEVPVSLSERPEGSSSKISIVRDGFLILHMIFSLFRDYKPLTFFGSLGILLMLIGILSAAPVVYEFFETGLVPRLPTAVLAVGLELGGMLLITVGLILHTIIRKSQEFEHQINIIFDELKRK